MRNFGGRIIGTEFRGKDGSMLVPDFEKLVKSYRVEYFKAETPDEVAKTLASATKLDSPAVVEVVVENRFPNAGPKAYGYWDLPSRVV